MLYLEWPRLIPIATNLSTCGGVLLESLRLIKMRPNNCSVIQVHLVVWVILDEEAS